MSYRQGQQAPIDRLHRWIIVIEQSLPSIDHRYRGSTRATPSTLTVDGIKTRATHNNEYPPCPHHPQYANVYSSNEVYRKGVERSLAIWLKYYLNLCLLLLPFSEWCLRVEPNTPCLASNNPLVWRTATNCRVQPQRQQCATRRCFIPRSCFRTILER